MSEDAESPKNGVELSSVNEGTEASFDLEMQAAKLESSVKKVKETEKKVRNGTKGPRPSVNLHLPSSSSPTTASSTISEDRNQGSQLKKRKERRATKNVGFAEQDIVSDALNAAEGVSSFLSPLGSVVDDFMDGTADSMAIALNVSAEALATVTAWEGKGHTRDGGRVVEKVKAYEIVSRVAARARVPQEYTLTHFMNVLESRIHPAFALGTDEGTKKKALADMWTDGLAANHMQEVEGIFNHIGWTQFHSGGQIVAGLDKVRSIEFDSFEFTSFFIQASDSGSIEGLAAGTVFFFQEKPDVSKPFQEQSPLHSVEFAINPDHSSYSELLCPPGGEAVRAKYVGLYFEDHETNPLLGSSRSTFNYTTNPRGIGVRYVGFGGRMVRKDKQPLKMPKLPLEAEFFHTAIYDMNPGFRVFQSEETVGVGGDASRRQHSIENILSHRTGDYISPGGVPLNTVLEYLKVSKDRHDGFELHTFQIAAMDNENFVLPQFGVIAASVEPSDLERFKGKNRLELQRMAASDDNVFLLDFGARGKKKGASRKNECTVTIPDHLRSRCFKYLHIYVPSASSLRMCITHITLLGRATNAARRPMNRVVDHLLSGRNPTYETDELGDVDEELAEHDYEDEKGGATKASKSKSVKLLSSLSHNYYCAVEDLRLEKNKDKQSNEMHYSIVLPFTAMGNLSLGNLPEPENARLWMLTPTDHSKTHGAEHEHKKKGKAEKEPSKEVAEEKAEEEAKEEATEQEGKGAGHNRKQSAGGTFAPLSNVASGFAKGVTLGTKGVTKGLGKGMKHGMKQGMKGVKGLGNLTEAATSGLSSGLQLLNREGKDEVPEVPFVVVAFTPVATIVDTELPTKFTGYYRFKYPQDMPDGSSLFFEYSAGGQFSLCPIHHLPPKSEAVERRAETVIQRTGPPLPEWHHLPHDLFTGVAKSRKTLVPLSSIRNHTVTHLYDESGLGSVMALETEVSVMVPKCWYFEVTPSFGELFQIGWCQDRKTLRKLTTWALDLSGHDGDVRGAGDGTFETTQLLGSGAEQASRTSDLAQIALGTLVIGVLLDTSCNEVHFFKNGKHQETLTLVSSMVNAFPIIFLEPWSDVEVELCHFSHFKKAMRWAKENSESSNVPEPACPGLQYTAEQLSTLNYKIRLDEWNRAREPGEAKFDDEVKAALKESMPRNPDPGENPTFALTGRGKQRRRRRVDLALLGDDGKSPARLAAVVDAHLRQILDQVFFMVDEDCTGLLDPEETRSALHLSLDPSSDFDEAASKKTHFSYMPTDEELRLQYKSELNKGDFQHLFFTCLDSAERLKKSRQSQSRKSMRKSVATSSAAGLVAKSRSASKIVGSKTNMMQQGSGEGGEALSDMTPLPHYRLLLLHHLMKEKDLFGLMHNNQNAKIVDALRDGTIKVLLYIFFPFFLLYSSGCRFHTLILGFLAASYYLGVAPIYFFFMNPDNIIFLEALMPFFLTVLLAVYYIEVKMMPRFGVTENKELEERYYQTKLALKDLKCHSFGSDQPEKLSLARMVEVLDPSQAVQTGQRKPMSCLGQIFLNVLPLFVTVVHCAIPGLVRVNRGQPFLTTDEKDVLFVELVFLIMCFIALLRITRSLTKVCWNYIASNEVFKRVTAMTFPPWAAKEDLRIFIDLAEADSSNAPNWLFLRRRLRDLQVKKTAAAFYVLGPTILFVLVVMLIMVVNILFLGGETTGTITLVGAWDCFVLTVYVLVTLGIIVVTNGELCEVHMTAVQRRSYTLVEEMQDLTGIDLEDAQKQLEMLTFIKERMIADIQKDGVTIFGLLLTKPCLMRLGVVMASGSGTIIGSVLKSYLAQESGGEVTTTAPAAATTLLQ